MGLVGSNLWGVYVCVENFIFLVCTFLHCIFFSDFPFYCLKMKIKVISVQHLAYSVEYSKFSTNTSLKKTTTKSSKFQLYLPCLSGWAGDPPVYFLILIAYYLVAHSWRLKNTYGIKKSMDKLQPWPLS